MPSQSPDQNREPEPHEQAVFAAVEAVRAALQGSRFADVLTGNDMKELALLTVDVALPCIKVAAFIDLADVIAAQGGDRIAAGLRESIADYQKEISQ